MSASYDADWERDVPVEQAGFEQEAMVVVPKFTPFWRTFVKSPAVVDLIDNGYRLLGETVVPATREFPNAPSVFEYRESVTCAIKEMVEAGALTRLPKGQRPTVVFLIRVVRKPRSDKFRLVINMKYGNKHLAKKVFKFKGFYIVEKGDHSVSYDMKSAGYYDVGLQTLTRRFVGIKWEGVHYVYTCLPFGLSTTPWVFSKVMREIGMY